MDHFIYKRSDDDLRPQIREFQQRISANYDNYPDLSSVELTKARHVVEAVREEWTCGGPCMEYVEELYVGKFDTRIRILRPNRCNKLPALVYLHGGGWTMFSIDTHDRLMREYASAGNLAVIGVEYSLSPEAKYPLAIEETLEVIRWLRQFGSKHGIDNSKIAVGGDSAGANLGIASQIKLLSMGCQPVSAMLLNYGVYTDQETASNTRYDGPSYMLQNNEMRWFWNNYLRTEEDRYDPLVQPLLADLEGLPQTFMVIAECDILFDGNKMMEAALHSANVSVTAKVYSGTTHSFLEAVSISEVANQAIKDSSNWLKQNLLKS